MVDFFLELLGCGHARLSLIPDTFLCATLGSAFKLLTQMDKPLVGYWLQVRFAANTGLIHCAPIPACPKNS